MTARWPTAEERRQTLARLLMASRVNATGLLPRIDRLLSGIVREWHLPVAMTLIALGYTLTWEGVAAAIESLATLAEGASASGAQNRLLVVLDNAITTATMAALRLADPAPLVLAVGAYYRLPNDEVVAACGMGCGWWRLLGRFGDYIISPDGAIACAPVPPTRTQRRGTPAATDWLIQDLRPATEAEFG